MFDFRPADYNIVLEASDAPEGVDYLTLRRFYIAAPMEGLNGFAFLFVLGGHFPTLAQAAERLPAALEECPGAAIQSVLLAFNPEIPEQAEAFARLSAEAEERREALQ